MAGWDKDKLPLAGRTIIDLGQQVTALKEELRKLHGDIFNLCNGDRLLEGADNNACILESYINSLRARQVADAHHIQKLQSTVAELEAQLGEPPEIDPEGLAEHEASLPPE